MGIIRKSYLLFALCLCTGWAFAGGPPRIALLMPFSLDQIKSSDLDKAHPISRAALEYYQGVLLAIDSLEKAGIDLEAAVFDVKKDTATIRTLIQSGELKDFDAYLGPFLNDRFELMSRFAANQESPIISPLATFPNSFENERYIHMNPTYDAYGKRFADEIVVRYQDAKIVLFSDQSAVAKASIEGLKKSLPKELFAKITIVTVKPGENLYDTHADKDRKTVFFIPSTDEKYVNDVIKKLGTSKGKSVTEFKKNIEIYGYQSWADFKMASYNLWDKFNLHLMGSHHYDRRDSSQTAFRTAFFEKFGTEPSEFSVKGYDQFILLATLMHEHGRKFQKHLDDHPYPAHHTVFRFEKQDKEGYYNTTVHILEFRNYRLQPVAE